MYRNKTLTNVTLSILHLVHHNRCSIYSPQSSATRLATVHPCERSSQSIHTPRFIASTVDTVRMVTNRKERLLSYRRHDLGTFGVCLTLISWRGSYRYENLDPSEPKPDEGSSNSIIFLIRGSVVTNSKPVLTQFYLSQISKLKNDINVTIIFFFNTRFYVSITFARKSGDIGDASETGGKRYNSCYEGIERRRENAPKVSYVHL